MLVPTPIGAGPAYHPRPAMHAPCAHGSAPARRVHLELFARGRVVIVPARVGVRSAGCHAQAWTSDPTGVVRFAGAATLREVFAIWGEPLGRRQMLSFHGFVSLFRNGLPVRGDPRRLVLRNGDEIVLEVGRHVPPHASYRFPSH